MLRSRWGFAATRLLDDRILVVSGSDSVGGSIPSAEVFDPQTGLSVYTRCDMLVARRLAVAVTLQDGRVLIVGGHTGNQFMLRQTEIYDPSTDCFTPGPVLREQRHDAQHVVLLADGRVLVLLGFPTMLSDTAGGAEIFDPTGDSFTVVNRDLGKQTDHGTPVVLRSGRVLVVGGDISRDGLVSPSDRAVMFDPKTARFVELPARLTVARDFIAAAPLPNGNALLIGGGVGSATDIVERFVEEDLTFLLVGHLSRPRLLASAIPIGSRTLVVGGKARFGDPPFASTEWLDLVGGAAGDGPPLPAGVAIGHYVFVLSNGGIVVLKPVGDPPTDSTSVIEVSLGR